MSDNTIIVAGVDFEQTGESALSEAMALSRQIPDSELHVAHVLKVDEDMHNAKKLDALSDLIQKTNARMTEHLQLVCAPGKGEKAFEHTVVVHVRLGQPGVALHQLCVDVNADFLVVGTHARKGVKKLLLGSVAEELSRTARLPVIVAHPKDYSDLEHSAGIEPARPGQDPSREGMSKRVRLEFVSRTSHISNLI